VRQLGFDGCEDVSDALEGSQFAALKLKIEGPFDINAMVIDLLISRSYR
jgi:hypothetical protein